MTEADLKAVIQDVATPHSEIPDDLSLSPAEVLHHIELDSIDDLTLSGLTQDALSQYDPEE
jgi:hypothetical protein